MPISVEYSIISYFDVHVTNVPLLHPELVRPEARFLFARDHYNRAQSQKRPLQIRDTRVYPLTMEVGHDHLLRSYLQCRYPCTELEVNDYWRICFPFRLSRNINTRLVVGTPPATFEGQFRLETLIWPTGWSTNVSVPILRRSSLPVLSELSQAVHRQAVFAIGDERLTLSEVFSRSTSELLDRLFLNPYAIPGRPSVPRYSIKLLASDSEEVRKWDKMSSAERTRLHEILRGQPIDDALRLRLEREGGFAVVSSLRDFTLIDLDRGMLTVAADALATKRWRRLGCLASNLRKAAVMAFALAGTRVMEGEGRVEVIRGGARQVLARLPTRYYNRAARWLYEHHARFRVEGG